MSLANGRLVALDPGTGEEVWSFDSGAPLVSSAASWDAAPAPGSRPPGPQDIVFPGTDGSLYVAREGPGTPSVRVERLPVKVADLVGLAPSPAADGSLVLGSQHTTVYVLDGDTGQLLRTVYDFEGDPGRLLPRERGGVQGLLRLPARQDSDDQGGDGAAGKRATRDGLDADADTPPRNPPPRRTSGPGPIKGRVTITDNTAPVPRRTVLVGRKDYVLRSVDPLVRAVWLDGGAWGGGKRVPRVVRGVLAARAAARNVAGMRFRARRRVPRATTPCTSTPRHHTPSTLPPINHSPRWVSSGTCRGRDWRPWGLWAGAA